MMGLLSLSHRPARWLVGCSLGLTMVVLPACTGAGRSDAGAPAGTVTLVNRVKARVKGPTCPTCASAVEAALRRRINNVVITVDQSQQTIDLNFDDSATPFSSASFRQALAETKGDVVSITIEACGTIATAEGRSWLESGSTRLLVDGSETFVAGTETCVTGDLRDQERPPRLVIGRFGT